MLGEFPVSIIAHSLGASVALLYSGLFPEKVGKLVCVEGMGPPPVLASSFFDKPFPSGRASGSSRPAGSPAGIPAATPASRTPPGACRRRTASSPTSRQST